MTHPSNQHPALGLSRTVLRALTRLNLLVGALILTLFVASLAWPGPVIRALGVRPGADSEALAFWMRGIMVVGILAVPLAHVVFTRLLAIVESVTNGDPFVAANAVRLQAIAWAALGLEALHLVVGVIAMRASTGAQELDLAWKLSVTRPLAILLLFVLARVFDQGTRMRDELAGTV